MTAADRRVRWTSCLRPADALSVSIGSLFAAAVLMEIVPASVSLIAFLAFTPMAAVLFIVDVRFRRLPNPGDGGVPLVAGLLMLAAAHDGHGVPTDAPCWQ
jgi:hypothetical protein